MCVCTMDIHPYLLDIIWRRVKDEKKKNQQENVLYDHNPGNHSHKLLYIYVYYFSYHYLRFFLFLYQRLVVLPLKDGLVRTSMVYRDV